MEQTLRDIESKDGLRMTWNILPINKPEFTKQSVPIACLYSPHSPTTLLPYEPIFCQNSSCRGIINPFCQINFQSQDWTCNFCSKRNLLPSHYKNLDSENLASELLEENTTIEYLLSRESNTVNCYFFILDVCFFDEERRKLALDALIATYNNLPEDSFVGLITFGTNIELFDLSNSEIEKIYLFSGKKSYKKEEVLKLGNLFDKFLVKKNSYLLNFIQEIKADPFPVFNGRRQVRCTGAAISLANALLSNTQEMPVKYFLYTQGPCTIGPGAIASISLTEGIRSYSDILKGKCPFTKLASEFYLNLAKEIANKGHSIDILAATLLDIGIYEMRPLTDLTGGLILLAQDFNYEIYLSSCLKMTKKTENEDFLDLNFNSKIKILTSQNLIFKKFLGVGMEIPNGWKINSLYKETNICLILDSLNPKNEEIGFIQIITQKQRSDKKIVTRVTTIARLFSDCKQTVLSGFDQEAAMVLQARLFTSKSEPEEEIDLIRRIDRILVKFLRSYASYQLDSPNSVNLPSTMSYFPNFVYFFRRSPLVLLEAISPDEGAYHRNLLFRENTINCMTMIVPTLISYHYQGEVFPAEMDARSLNPEVILLLDTFHNVVVWKGNYIAQWVKEKLHLKEEYLFLKELIESVELRANELVRNRLPTPKLTICDQFGSQERILLARVNPSVKEKVVTDDIDFEAFKGFLYRLTVSS